MSFVGDDDPGHPAAPRPAPAGGHGMGAGRGGAPGFELREGLSMPHSLEAEREVLGAVLVDPTSLDVIAEHLKGEDFYLERHTLVYEAMRRVSERTGTVDLVTLHQELKDAGVWEKMGGAPTLGALLERAGTTSNLEHYCKIVQAKAMLRRMIEAARTIETEGLQDVGDVAEYLDAAEKRVFAVLEERSGANMRPMSDVVRATIEQIEKTYNAEGSVTGLTTGFRDLDKLTHGLHAGDLIILAARPAMGKTSFVLNLAVNSALKGNASVAVFSLEMPAEQLAARMLASEARIDVSRMRGGNLDHAEWPRLVEAADRLSKARIYMNDGAGATPATIRAQCRRLARREGLDLIVIDYLQLMSGGDRTKSREQEISQISRSLKHLAKELGCPVIALSQLNRSLESRTDKRPMMSDLRESGAIEQDADIIGFIYREEVYNKNVDEETRGVAELIIGKHRNGPTGTVKLKFWNAYTRFDNLAIDYG